MRAMILILGVMLMPWLDDMKAVSGAIAQQRPTRTSERWPPQGQEFGREDALLGPRGVGRDPYAPPTPEELARLQAAREQQMRELEEWRRLQALGLTPGKKPVPRY